MKSKEVLQIEEFDPHDIDITFLKEVSRRIPTEGYIDPAMAEQLATVCLQAADKAVDLLAQATLYLSHCDALKRSAKAEAINAAIERKVPSTVAKEVYAADENYRKATSKYNTALAWHTWLETKRDTLVKTHHLCKDLVRKAEGNMSTNWEPAEQPPSAPKKLSEDQEEAKTTKKVGPVDW